MNAQRLSIVRLTPLVLMCSVIAALTSPAHAQSQHTDKPYHIEMVIFERINNAYNTTEYWPTTQVLAYPPHYRVIQPQDPLTATANNNLNNNLNNSADDNKPLVSERILWERPQETYALTAQANAINRKASMRVLFHKAWQQTLHNTPNAPAVIINGGDTFDARTELGGSVRVSVNKFIHVDTQLWLARFTPNYGQAQHWPIPPLAPTATTPASVNNAPADPLTIKSLALEQDSPIFGINEQALAAMQATNVYRGTVSTQPSPIQPALGGTAFNNPTRHSTLGSATRQPALQHITEQVVHLEQSRRMRSQELHYIDHPRLGILVKVIAIESPEAQQE